MCRPGEPTRAEEWLDKVSLAFQRAKYADDAELVRDARLSVKDRLEAVIDGLNYSRFTLVLDGFDNNLHHASRQFHNNDIRHFYQRLLEGLVGDLRVVITSRFLPADIEVPERFLELNLGELPETAYLKFLLRDDEIKARYLANRLTRRTLLDLRRRFGSAPLFVVQMRDKLRETRYVCLAGRDESKGPFADSPAWLGVGLPGEVVRALLRSFKT